MSIADGIGRVGAPQVGRPPQRSLNAESGERAGAAVVHEPQASVARESEVAPRELTAEQQKAMRQTIEEINRSLKNLKVSRQFEVDESSGQMVITLYDTERGEKIRQIPNDFDLKRISEVKKYLGVLYDDNA